MDTPSAHTLFHLLIRERGWEQFEVFARKYQEAARVLAEDEGPPQLATARIEEWQFKRWARGQIKSAPRKEARRILAYLFRPTPVDALFTAPLSSGSANRAPQASDGCGDSHTRGQAQRSVDDMVMNAAAESADWAARVEGSNVGPHTMEQLAADIRRIVATYPHRPVEPLFYEVRKLRDRAFELLEGRQPPHLTGDLYMAAGVLCGVLANASFDLGRYDCAETQARAAFMCGELARHNGLRAWVRGLQALIAYWDGRPTDAVRLAESGAAFTPEQGTAQIRLASIKARAHGQLGQRSDALAALLEADTLREQLTAGDDLPGGMMAFPHEKQMFYASTTHLWLGPQDVADAQRAAESAVDIFQSAAPDQRRLGEESLARMDLAFARLGHGELEGAARQVHAVLETDARRGTASVKKRIDHFTRTLALHPSATSPTAIGLREALVAHQDRGTRELPRGGSSSWPR